MDVPKPYRGLGLGPIRETGVGTRPTPTGAIAPNPIVDWVLGRFERPGSAQDRPLRVRLPQTLSWIGSWADSRDRGRHKTDPYGCDCPQHHASVGASLVGALSRLPRHECPQFPSWIGFEAEPIDRGRHKTDPYRDIGRSFTVSPPTLPPGRRPERDCGRGLPTSVPAPIGHR